MRGPSRYRNFDDPSLPKASGHVELPLHIRWSGQPIVYDLDDGADRARVYEQLLREGTEEDVRYYVDSDRLRDLWGERGFRLPSGGRGPTGSATRRCLARFGSKSQRSSRG